MPNSWQQTAISDGVGRILVVGGDGTIHEVVNGILQANHPPPSWVWFPWAPETTSSECLGTRRTRSGPSKRLESGSVEAFDVGWVSFNGSESYFVNLLGVGMDVEVSGRGIGSRNCEDFRNTWRPLTSALLTYRPTSFRVSFLAGERGRNEGNGGGADHSCWRSR